METISIVIYICIFLSTLLTYPLIKKQKKKHDRLVKLPPGSMGWPLIGETLQLYSQDPKVFFTARQKRSLKVSKILYIFFSSLAWT